MIKTSIKWIIRLVLLVSVLVAVLVFLLMQPTFESRKSVSDGFAKPEKLKQIVKFLSDDLAKHPNPMARLELTRQYIESQFSNLGLESRLQSFEVEGQTYSNVIVDIPSKKDCPLVVIGAHYDTYHNLPGADDNASGVAALIELGGALSRSNKVRCPIQLVAYANEEPPFFRTPGMGSYVHAKSLKDEGIEISFMLSLETLGYFSDEEGSQLYPTPVLSWLYPSKGNFITLVGNLSQMSLVREVKSGMQPVMSTEVYSINAPVSVPGIDFSDHRSYWEFDYPALMVTDTAFNRNLNYHTEDDTYEKLDYERMADIVNGLYHFLTTQ